MPTTFPEDFKWGVATASYQIEGAVKEGGRGVSIWDTFSHSAGKTLHGDHGDIADDHYHRMQEDIGLMGELGVHSYRFSIAWPRVQPEGKGPVNKAGIDFYKRLIDCLGDQGIEAAVTLYHWDLPQALEDLGGWQVATTADRFADYAAIVASELGGSVSRWITLNEPWCAAWLGYGCGVHAPGVVDLSAAAKATHHLLLGHGKATQALRANDPAPVGITLNVHQAEAISDNPADVVAARLAEDQRNRLFLDPVFLGRYPEELSRHYRRHWAGLAEASAEDMAVISSPIDFLGINYYNWMLVKAVDSSTAGPGDFLGDLGATEVPPQFQEATAMGWRTDPSRLTSLLVELSKVADCPVFVTENGMAVNDYLDPEGRCKDPERIEYLKTHFAAVAEAIDSGVDMGGYYVWSFMDNFEWATGYSMRFGLVYVDYPTQARVPKDSFAFYQKVISDHGLT